MCPTYTMSSLISRNVATKTQVMSRMSTMPTQMHDNRENNATCDIQVWNKPKVNVAINDNDDNVVHVSVCVRSGFVWWIISMSEPVTYEREM